MSTQTSLKKQFTLPPFAPLHLDNFLAGFHKPAAAATDLSGTWVKDKARSDSLDDALRLMHLGGVVRTAVKLIRGIELKHNSNFFEMAVFSAVPWFKVRERYPMDGTAVKCRRRDFRRGGHQGSAAVKGGKVVLSLKWGRPHGGHGSDQFHLASPEVLHVDSTVCTTDDVCELYTTVYNRKR